MKTKTRAPAKVGARPVHATTAREFAPAQRRVPEPECAADVEILAGLSLIGAEGRYWYGSPLRYDWRAAQVASWSVPVGSCARCKRVVHWACWRWLRGGPCPYGCDREPGVDGLGRRVTSAYVAFDK